MNDGALVQMDAAELAQLSRFEERISQGLSSFIEVGEALAAIRDARLYRANYATFEDYCREKWGLAKRYCDRLIQSTEIVKNLGPIGPKITTESQARELSRVEPSRRREVVETAVVATGGKLTAAALKEAAQSEQTPPRRHAFKMPDGGLFIARGAINQLERILPTDGERTAALELVIKWCKKELKKNANENTTNP